MRDTTIRSNIPQQCKVHMENISQDLFHNIASQSIKVKSFLIKSYSKSLVHNCPVQRSRPCPRPGSCQGPLRACAGLVPVSLYKGLTGLAVCNFTVHPYPSHSSSSQPSPLHRDCWNGGALPVIWQAAALLLFLRVSDRAPVSERL